MKRKQLLPNKAARIDLHPRSTEQDCEEKDHAIEALNREVERLNTVLEQRSRELADRDLRIEELEIALSREISIRELRIEELEIALTKDPVSGFMNRKKLLKEFLPDEVKRAKLLGKPLSVIIMDLDHLKEINDCDGHAAGDEALRQQWDVIRKSMRESDTAARIGGDECVIVCEASAKAVEAVARRLGKEMRQRSVGSITLTCSIGYATLAAGMDADTLMQLADQALYAAKGVAKVEQENGKTKSIQVDPKGRDRIRSAESLPKWHAFLEDKGISSDPKPRLHQARRAEDVAA
jgi:diguanylate cyclase (GGDEF)-like protein